ncbi:MAG: rRNA maturation RNase YbeY [Desulfobacteraceae bacterium 4572_88]|nr:MAG: rRNA maturation RNase YbeY [Desulfobacteraceae bacterium 4572_88]
MILISNRQSSQEIAEAKIRKAAKAILNALACHDGELSIVLVDDAEIAVLNKDYLNREGPTNVISFPMQDDSDSQTPVWKPAEDMQKLLGDVVISLDTTQREAGEMGISTQERFMELLVHGILHLFGYDHENDDEQAAQMEARSREMLGMISGG